MLTKVNKRKGKKKLFLNLRGKINKGKMQKLFLIKKEKVKEKVKVKVKVEKNS